MDRVGRTSVQQPEISRNLVFKLRKHAGLAIESILLSVLAILFVFPFLWMVLTALKSPEEALIFPPTLMPQTWNFQSFAEVWQSGPFGTYLTNSVVIVAAILAAQLITAVPSAYVFAKYRFKGKEFLFLLVLLTMIIPSQLTFVPLYLMMSEWQLLDSLVPLILPFVVTPFGIFLLRQQILQIPDELFEAAKIDGAGEGRTMYHVLLPMIKPAVVTVMLLSFITHWNDYFWPLVMTNTMELRTLPLGVANLKGLEGNSKWNVVMAGNCILALPLLILFMLNSKRLKESIAFTGVK
ncbi:carbohydrate ABC transporter permease [Paenibacillus campinasensis]|uniref:Sugar ABC transporter permease n=1 Tax=Paenibacillus campinasensis TaxID=66347 RepID=A0A268EQ89_9BACL|nr:carbohydrate ABC transporter permease [Paenibacillus campinasensis]PAD75294.1 sugar ABC transporter permease [Paenibacillus campinasensis]